MTQTNHKLDTTHCPVAQGATVILGLSGGPDSVYLLHMLAQEHHAGKISLIAAHLDHQWRHDSHQDAMLCAHLAQRYSIPFVMQCASELKLERRKHESLEAFGRRLRRTFFKQVATEHHADYVALAHHADDQAETFILRLMRGTSLAGLTCMKEIDGLYYRPLLSKQKQELVNFLDAHGIPYITDPTNQSEAFLRNAVRVQILPKLASIDARWNGNIQTTIARLQEAERCLEKITIETYARTTQPIRAGAALDCNLLATYDSYLQKRLVLHWLIQHNVQFNLTERFLDEIVRFLCSERGGTHRMNRSWCIIKKHHYAQISYGESTTC